MRPGRRCAASCAGSATWSTTSRATGEAAHLSVGDGLKVDKSLAYYDQDGFKDWTHAGDRRPSAQGAASRVRDVEPGHPRPLRRGLRRLPHALQARGRRKISDHHVRSPLLNINHACQTCHKMAEGELKRACRNHPAPHVAEHRNLADGRARRADRRTRKRPAPRMPPTGELTNTPSAYQRTAQFYARFRGSGELYGASMPPRRRSGFSVNRSTSRAWVRPR